MENPELGNPEEFVSNSPALSRRAFLRQCYHGGKKIVAASFASSTLGLFTYGTVLAPGDETATPQNLPIPRLQGESATVSQARPETTNIAKNKSELKPNTNNTATNRVNTRQSVAEKNADSSGVQRDNRESINVSDIYFVDRLNQSLRYGIFGLNRNHTYFYIDPERQMLYPRKNAIILPPGIDFNGLDAKYSEWEKWVVATTATTTADKIENELVKAKSPLMGLGKFIYDLGGAYGVDPNFFMAICFLESNYATVDSVARKRLNTGSLRHSPLSVGEKGGFADFPNWETGIIAWYELISKRYFVEWQKLSVNEIIDLYAPPSENDTPGYKQNVKNRMNLLRIDTRLKAEDLGISVS